MSRVISPAHPHDSAKSQKYGVESVRPDTQDRLVTEGIREGNRYPDHLPAAPRAGSGQRMRKQVAVIGSGPAGLGAAHDLALLGYEVAIYESDQEPGGMMRFGIPEYRLPRNLIRAEVDKILGLGVALHLESPLRPGFGLAELRQAGFEAVFLSVGVAKGRDLDLPGADLDGVVKAVDYLLNLNHGYRAVLGRRVVVIGGGFVAFDAARMALRVTGEGELDMAVAQAEAFAADARVQEALDSARAAIRGGAAEVTIVSLEAFGEMPALKSAQGLEEFEEAEREGVRFLHRRGPRRFLGAGGHLAAVEFRKVLSVFDDDGRFAPTFDDGDLVTLEADGCILAIGQKANLDFLRPEDGIDLTPGGTIRVDPQTLATSAPGVFAGGDVAFGPRTLIEGVANGKRAARSIHRYLAQAGSGPSTLLEIEKIPTARYRMIAGFEQLDREAPPTQELDRRTGISEVEEVYSEREAREQAARCLVCHVQTIYDPEKCVLCNRCVDVCPEYCLELVPLAGLDLPETERRAVTERAAGGALPLSAMVKDDQRCIRCGLCALRCPTDAMTMERFTVTERLASQDA